MTNSGIWNPQDDLLLKNAVEAGASLEALAKGAIHFSRRYSYKELQDRWHLLLYDPDVSALASTGMFELELSGTYPSTKSIKSGNYKANRDFPEMRKRGNIRKQYYAMRKKSRIEFFSYPDLLFFDVPSLNQSHDQRSNSREHHNEIFIQNDLGLDEDDLDILRSLFPETMGCASSPHFRDTTNGYPADCTISIGNDCQNGILGNEFPLGFFNSVREDERDSPTAAPKCFDMSSVIRSSVPGSGKCEAIKEPDPVQVLPGKRLSRSSEEKQLAASDSCHDNSRSTCDFRGAQNFTSASFEGNCLQAIGFPSPRRHFPSWNNMEDCLASSVPVCIRDQDTDGNFVDLSESLLNLVNEDEITFIGANEQDAVDETLTCYRPAFDQVERNIDCEAATLTVEETIPSVSNCIPSTMLETIASSPQNKQTNVRHLDDNAPVVINKKEALISGISTKFHEPDCSVMCCTLNTEDLDIPCNDDIFLLIHPFSFSSSLPSSGDALDMTSSAIGDARVINLSSKEKNSLDSLQCHPNLRPSQSQDIQLCNPYLDCVVESKFTEPNAPHANASKAPESSDLYRSSNGFTDKLPGDHFSIARGEGTLASLEEMTFSADGDLLKEHVPQQAINGATSDPEEFQSDDEVPCTSDVETMILGMDLDPPGEANSIGVTYLSEETKRNVMRLEQCVQSVLQEALKSQEALAILYGRRLKHYIRKTEVVLGRSSDDVDIDINLRNERRGNKLSRRQAIIKMDADGSFVLKNIGKSTISVNGMPASCGQSLFLSSGCLIEIAGMSFVFEISRKHV
ncbi:hypothetical protein Leryth_024941 [Lithospermum erythrorhizon]|nr:hypothetical protein Leryth_024941 [Lithospermum erythrorhizon]